MVGWIKKNMKKNMDGWMDKKMVGKKKKIDGWLDG